MTESESKSRDNEPHFQINFLIKFDNNFERLLVENWKSLEGSFLDEVRSRKVSDPQISVSVRALSSKELNNIRSLYLLMTNVIGLSFGALPRAVITGQFFAEFPSWFDLGPDVNLIILEYTKPTHSVQLLRVNDTKGERTDCALIAYVEDRITKIYDKIEEVSIIIEMFAKILSQFSAGQEVLPIEKLNVVGMIDVQDRSKITSFLTELIGERIKELISDAKKSMVTSIEFNMDMDAKNKQYTIKLTPQLIGIKVNYSNLSDVAAENIRARIKEIIQNDFVKLRKQMGVNHDNSS